MFRVQLDRRRSSSTAQGTWSEDRRGRLRHCSCRRRGCALDRCFPAFFVYLSAELSLNVYKKNSKKCKSSQIHQRTNVLILEWSQAF